MRLIEHDILGHIDIIKPYLVVDEPVIFTCTFEKDPSKQVYLGMQFEQFEVSDFEVGSNENITNYYFAPIDNNQIQLLEHGNSAVLSLWDVFVDMPAHGAYSILWCSHRMNPNTKKVATLWHMRTSVSPYYRMPRGTTLCLS
jgi:hypothetical protein